MFYSQEQYDEYQADLSGDGFSNEYQRAYFRSRLERPIPDEHAEAERLHKAGRFVVCGEYEVCCKRTDGLLGYAWVVEKDFATREEAEAYIGIGEDRADGVFLYQPKVKKSPEPVVTDFDDEVPF